MDRFNFLSTDLGIGVLNYTVKLPDNTVFTTAKETAPPSPLLAIDPCEPPLNAKNPKNRINPPSETNW